MMPQIMLGRAKQAFSLVELSIVLVILGLIVGGVLSGQSLIRAAEMRSVGTEYTRYTTAVMTFRDKYFQIPGDFSQATSFWGAQAGGTADGVDNTCAVLTVAATGAATCNGNGNGQIAENTYLTFDDRLLFYEAYRAWQHLANAGLIEGQYAGVSYNGRTAFTNFPGRNVPASKAGKSAGWLFRYIIPGYGSPGVWFTSSWGNILVIGQAASSGSGPVFTPQEAWNVDTKFDDGKPGTGIILPYMSALNPGCTLADTATTDYNLAGTSIACSLNILLKV